MRDMQLKTLNTVAAIFDVLGGSRAVQELTGDKPTTVSNWRNWNVCPANTYDLFLRELAVRGYWAPSELFAQRERNSKNSKTTPHYKNKLLYTRAPRLLKPQTLGTSQYCSK